MTDVNEAQQSADFAREWNLWHEEHDKNRASKHGFLAVTGLTWLTEKPVRISGIPGLWSRGEDGVVVELAEGETISVGEQTVTGWYVIGVLAPHADATLFAGDIAIEVAERGGHVIVRPRDPESAYLKAYEGTPTFDPDPRWRIPATFEPYGAVRAAEVGSVAEGLVHVFDNPGDVVFEVDGVEYRLAAFPGFGEGLRVLFTDETSGVTTYRANRSVEVDAPDQRGATVIDFNRATNLPCAYTDYATCPLPPAGNRLPFAVEAGEKIPLARVTAALDS